MNDDEFFQFCQSRYDAVLESSESIYNRYSFLMTVIIAVGAANFSLFCDARSAEKLTAPGWLSCISACVCFVALAGGALCLVFSMLPKRYDELARMKGFHDWREKYRTSLDPMEYASDEIEKAVCKHTRESLLRLMLDAESQNRTTRDRRLWWYNISLYFAAGSVIAIGMQVASLAIHDAIKDRTNGKDPTTSTAPSAERTESAWRWTADEASPSSTTQSATTSHAAAAESSSAINV